MEDEKEKRVQQFLDLNRQSTRGRLKIYIGMSAGVGKTYRMLQEAHSLLRNNVNLKVGYVETHGRKETEDLIEGLPVIPRKTIVDGRSFDEPHLTPLIAACTPSNILCSSLPSG